MKITVKNNERESMERYVGAVCALANTIEDTDAYTITSLNDLPYFEETVKELGIEITSFEDETEIKIPSEFVELYMELCIEFMVDVTPEIKEVYNLYNKYSNVINKAIDFMGALDAFVKPVKDIKDSLFRLKRVANISGEKLMTKVEKYVESITRG